MVVPSSRSWLKFRTCLPASTSTLVGSVVSITGASARPFSSRASSSAVGSPSSA